MTSFSGISFLFIVLIANILSFYSFYAKFSPASSQLKDLNRFRFNKVVEQESERKAVIVCNGVPPAAAINQAAASAISKLMSVCGIGYCAGRAGLLDANTLSVLSKLVFTIIQPCFIFNQVLSSIAKESEKGINGSLLLLPLMAALQIFLGYTIGFIVSKILYAKNTDSDDAKQLLACTTFGNSGPLPLVFTDAIFRSHPDPTLLSKGNAYISLYLLGWSPLFWIVGPSILRDKTDDSAISATEKRRQLLTRIFNPPVLASIVGLIIGCIQPLSRLLVPKSGIFHCVFAAVETISSAYLPCALLILSGSLAASSASSSSSASTANASDSDKEKSNLLDVLIQKVEENWHFAVEVFSVYFSKFVLMPSLSFFLIDLLIR